MAKRKKTSSTRAQPEQPHLIQPRSDVEAKIRERIEVGRGIQGTDIRSDADLKKARSEKDKWNDYNLEYLRRVFDTGSVAEQYESAPGWGALIMNASLGQQIESFCDGIANKITELESLVDRLELIPESTIQHQTDAPMMEGEISGRPIFIVHGHDEAAKTNVARFVEKLGLEAVILHEQANKGQTLIEKFESNAATAGFAVILLTPDDIGAPKDSPDNVKERARQNVILELGYFSGALGRDRVCVLHKESVEIPSDYFGVTYIPFDEDGGWHIKLAKEIKESGMDVDLNRAL